VPVCLFVCIYICIYVRMHVRMISWLNIRLVTRKEGVEIFELSNNINHITYYFHVKTAHNTSIHIHTDVHIQSMRIYLSSVYL
jgi:hypothetical protein